MSVFRLAGCVITNDQGHLLLLHRSTSRQDQWELPGGKVEAGETDEAAAERELANEIGVKTSGLRKIGEHSFSDRDFNFHFVWFKPQSITGQPKILEPEIFKEVRYFDKAELATLPLSVNMQNLMAEIAAGNILV